MAATKGGEMMANYRVFCVSEAISPITHMRGTEGNEALLQREPVHVPGHGFRQIPCLSANALRHKLVREPGARYLVEAYGLTRQLTLDALNFLFHGGSLYESTGKENLKLISEMHRIFPLYRLLGGCLPSQVVPGSLIVERGMLVCRENEARIRSLVPAGFDPPCGIKPAEMFVDGWQYVRNSAEKTAPDLIDAEKAEAGVQMIYSGQQVISGACFVHGFILQECRDIELGALLHSLGRWQSAGGTIGGMSSRGHGKLSTWLCLPDDHEACIRAYVKHVQASRDEAVDWLRTIFDVRPDTEEEKSRKQKSATKVRQLFTPSEPAS